jgi:beta-lysine 5,6-aminomutase alpha subunit
MATVPLDIDKVRRCRTLASDIADDVQGYVDAHTTVGVERAVLRAYGAEGTVDDGIPTVNLAVDRYAKAALLGHGMAFFLGRALLRGARDVQDATERLAMAPELDSGEGEPGLRLWPTCSRHTPRARSLGSTEHAANARPGRDDSRRERLR